MLSISRSSIPLNEASDTLLLPMCKVGGVDFHVLWRPLAKVEHTPRSDLSITLGMFDFGNVGVHTGHVWVMRAPDTWVRRGGVHLLSDVWNVCYFDETAMIWTTRLYNHVELSRFLWNMGSQPISKSCIYITCMYLETLPLHPSCKVLLL